MNAGALRATPNQKSEMMNNKVENGLLPSALADGKERIPCFWGFSPCLTFGLKPVSAETPFHPSAEADGNSRHFPFSTLHFQLTRHCERSEAIQTSDTKRPLDCFTARSSPFAMTFHAPRHFDRSARGTSARSGEIPYPTQGGAKQWVQDAGDSSTPLRSARNDCAVAKRRPHPPTPSPKEAV
jgi:hypothetical protein